jgi:hypothetical protein
LKTSWFQIKRNEKEREGTRKGESINNTDKTKNRIEKYSKEIN